MSYISQGFFDFFVQKRRGGELVQKCPRCPDGIICDGYVFRRSFSSVKRFFFQLSIIPLMDSWNILCLFVRYFLTGQITFVAYTLQFSNYPFLSLARLALCFRLVGKTARRNAADRRVTPLKISFLAFFQEKRPVAVLYFALDTFFTYPRRLPSCRLQAWKRAHSKESARNIFQCVRPSLACPFLFVRHIF